MCVCVIICVNLAYEGFCILVYLLTENKLRRSCGTFINKTQNYKKLPKILNTPVAFLSGVLDDPILRGVCIA